VIPSKSFQRKKKVRNLLRISLLLLIVPILYLGLWISISGEESLSYFQQVQQLMSYFPEFIRNPYGITLSLFGMSLLSSVFGFYSYLKSSSRGQQYFGLALSIFAMVITFWFGFTLM
jgi:hypothetical protein